LKNTDNDLSETENDYIILKINSKRKKKGCSVLNCNGSGNIVDGREYHYKKEFCPIFNKEVFLKTFFITK
jgi:hypothetical protein